MATRQYIGARYVPKFYENSDGTSAWTANTAYEALTIVTRNGNSYTSKKAVPANIGAPEDNPSYWVSTGIFNDQVAALDDRIDASNQRIEELSEYTGEAFPAYVMIGDSYGHASGHNYGWIDQLRTFLNITELYENALGGSGFVNGTTFNTLLTELAASMTEEQKSRVGKVIIAGGANDTQNTETTAAAVQTVCNNARTLFPNAVVYIGFISGRISNAYPAVFGYRTAAGYRKGAAYGKAIYLENVDYCLHDRKNLADDVHPNLTGYEDLGRAMAAALRNGYSYASADAQSVTSGNGTMNTTPTINYAIDNDTATLNLVNRLDLTFSTPVNLALGASVKIADLPFKAILGPSETYSAFNRVLAFITTTIMDANDQATELSGFVYVNDAGELMFTNTDVYNTGAHSTHSAIARIHIPPFSITAPSICC